VKLVCVIRLRRLCNDEQGNRGHRGTLAGVTTKLKALLSGGQSGVGASFRNVRKDETILPLVSYHGQRSQACLRRIQAANDVEHRSRIKLALNVTCRPPSGVPAQVEIRAMMMSASPGQRLPSACRIALVVLPQGRWSRQESPQERQHRPVFRVGQHNRQAALILCQWQYQVVVSQALWQAVGHRGVTVNRVERKTRIVKTRHGVTPGLPYSNGLR
jgi:hypothetical protein